MGLSCKFSHHPILWLMEYVMVSSIFCLLYISGPSSVDSWQSLTLCWMSGFNSTKIIRGNNNTQVELNIKHILETSNQYQAGNFMHSRCSRIPSSQTLGGKSLLLLWQVSSHWRMTSGFSGSAYTLGSIHAAFSSVQNSPTCQKPISLTSHCLCHAQALQHQTLQRKACAGNMYTDNNI